VDQTYEKSIHQTTGKGQLQQCSLARLYQIQLGHGKNNQEFGCLSRGEAF
jgi:hypothetical protein